MIWKFVAVLMFAATTRHCIALGNENPRTREKYGFGTIVAGETIWFIGTMLALYLSGFFDG